MHHLITASLLISVCVLSALAVDCNHGHSDGCSIPGGLPFFYKKTFMESCYKHDQCYYCGVKFGVDRRTCDKRFHANLKQHCDDPASRRFKGFCEVIRATYYLAVSARAKKSYNSTASESWCNESWVTECV